MTALVVVLIAGAVLFLTMPLDYMRNSSFQFKMVCLLLAIVFNYTIHNKVARSPDISLGGKHTSGTDFARPVGQRDRGGLFIAFVG